MFTKDCKSILLLIIILAIPGCFGGYSGDDGLDVAEMVFLKGGYEVEIAVEKGDAFGVDAVRPEGDLMVISGASFDPDVFRMESYVEYLEDGERHVRYLFTALADGGGTVAIKARGKDGAAETVFATVKVTVESGGGSLF